MNEATDSGVRSRVVAEALTWVGTSYHHGVCIKGRGVDCAQLPIAVYCGLGLVEPFDPGQYTPQWFLHRDEPRYLKWVEKFARRIEGWGEPGDFYMFNFGRHAAHGAIVIEPGVTMVHAYAPLKRVMLDDPKRFGDRFHSTWTVL